MESLYLIAPVAVIFCILAIAAWLWATQDGQFDDLDREARRILEQEPTKHDLNSDLSEKKTDHE